MPRVSHQVSVNAPLQDTWSFVEDMTNWAQLLPGYEEMRILSDTDSEWKVRGDVGILTKLVTMRVHVIEWIERSRVAFTVTCVEEPLTGTGSLVAEDAGDASLLTFNLEAEAGGMLGPVVNALLAQVMGGMAADFAGRIKTRIEELAERPGVGAGERS